MNALSTPLPTVAVIIPTTCEAKRWASLQRAISSARDQAATVTVIVVVNGARFDEAHYRTLQQDPRLTVVYREEGSAPLAQRFGRSLVEEEFFAFLDDDDEYLPQALWQRYQPFLTDASLAFVASNGFRHVGGTDTLVVRDSAAIEADPLAALARENWLASCGGLFRTASVAASYFDDPVPFLEWTYLAYKLGLDLKMRFVDVATFRIHDTPASLSKSVAYREAELAVLSRIDALRLPPHVRRMIRRKRGRVFHDLSWQARCEGRLGAAWRCHLQSLVLPEGWRYLGYSRKLLPMVA